MTVYEFKLVTKKSLEEEETITTNSLLQFKNQKPQNNKRKGGVKEKCLNRE